MVIVPRIPQEAIDEIMDHLPKDSDLQWIPPVVLSSTIRNYGFYRAGATSSIP